MEDKNMKKQLRQKHKPNLGEIQQESSCQEPREACRKEDANAIWDCGSPLYDSFELASLSYMLERHVMTLPYTKDLHESIESYHGNSENRKVQNAKLESRRDKRRLLRAVLNSLAFWKRGCKVGVL